MSRKTKKLRKGNKKIKNKKNYRGTRKIRGGGIFYSVKIVDPSKITPGKVKDYGAALEKLKTDIEVFDKVVKANIEAAVIVSSDFAERTQTDEKSKKILGMYIAAGLDGIELLKTALEGVYGSKSTGLTSDQKKKYKKVGDYLIFVFSLKQMGYDVNKALLKPDYEELKTILSKITFEPKPKTDFFTTDEKNTMLNAAVNSLNDAIEGYRAKHNTILKILTDKGNQMGLPGKADFLKYLRDKGDREADIKDIENQIKQLTDKQWSQFIRSFFSKIPSFSISTTAISDALESIREVFKNIQWEGSYLQKGLKNVTLKFRSVTDSDIQSLLASSCVIADDKDIIEKLKNRTYPGFWNTSDGESAFEALSAIKKNCSDKYMVSIANNLIQTRRTALLIMSIKQKMGSVTQTEIDKLKNECTGIGNLLDGYITDKLFWIRRFGKYNTNDELVKILSACKGQSEIATKILTFRALTLVGAGLISPVALSVGLGLGTVGASIGVLLGTLGLGAVAVGTVAEGVVDLGEDAYKQTSRLYNLAGKLVYGAIKSQISELEEEIGMLKNADGFDAEINDAKKIKGARDELQRVFNISSEKEQVEVGKNLNLAAAEYARLNENTRRLFELEEQLNELKSLQEKSVNSKLLYKTWSKTRDTEPIRAKIQQLEKDIAGAPDDITKNYYMSSKISAEMELYKANLHNTNVEKIEGYKNRMLGIFDRKESKKDILDKLNTELDKLKVDVEEIEKKLEERVEGGEPPTKEELKKDVGDRQQFVDPSVSDSESNSESGDESDPESDSDSEGTPGPFSDDESDSDVGKPAIQETKELGEKSDLKKLLDKLKEVDSELTEEDKKLLESNNSPSTEKGNQLLQAINGRIKMRELQASIDKLNTTPDETITFSDKLLLYTPKWLRGKAVNDAGLGVDAAKVIEVVSEPDPTPKLVSRPNKSPEDTQQGQKYERKQWLIRQINTILKENKNTVLVENYIEDDAFEKSDFEDAIKDIENERLIKLVESLDTLLNSVVMPDVVTDEPDKSAVKSGWFGNRLTQKIRNVESVVDSSIEQPNDTSRPSDSANEPVSKPGYFSKISSLSFPDVKKTLKNRSEKWTDTQITKLQSDNQSKISKLAGRSAVEYKSKLLAAIEALLDANCASSVPDIKPQLKKYQTLCTGDDKLTAELIKTNYGGFEAGLRESILKCPGIKEYAKLVLADYENRASKILSYTQRAKGVFTRKNSEGDSKISKYLDDVKTFIPNEAKEGEEGRNEALDAIEAVRNAVLLPDDKPKFEAEIDTKIAELTGKSDSKDELEKLQKAKTEVKGTIEKNVDIILKWLETEKSHEEGKIKTEQAKLKATKSPAEKAEINARIKTSNEKINGGPGIQLRSKSGIRFHERQISSIIDIKQIKRNTTLKKRTFSLFNRSSEKVDNTPKPQFNSGMKKGDVLPEFEIIKKNDDGTPKEFVSIMIKGEEIFIDGDRLDGTDDESRRKAWNEARSKILGLGDQIANTLPRFDDGKITLNVYPNGKVTIQLNDDPIIYIDDKAGLKRFKDAQRKTKQKPSMLSRISNPFKNMFGTREPSVPRTPSSVEGTAAVVVEGTKTGETETKRRGEEEREDDDDTSSTDTNRNELNEDDWNSDDDRGHIYGENDSVYSGTKSDTSSFKNEVIDTQIKKENVLAEIKNTVPLTAAQEGPVLSTTEEGNKEGSENGSKEESEKGANVKKMVSTIEAKLTKKGGKGGRGSKKRRCKIKKNISL